MKRFPPIDLSLVLSLATVIGMAMAVAGRWPPSEALGILELPGLVIVYLACGLPTAWRALSALWRKHMLDIDLLMIAAAIAAAVVGAPFEGAVLLTLFSISTTLEERALGRARRAIEALMALRPETALRRTESGIEEAPASELSVGDVVVLRPGARVPTDGVVVTGRGGVDEANITGESMPVSKEAGAQVFEATVNLDGVLEVEVSRTVGDSTIARMIRLVTEAQAARAPSERFSDWFGQRLHGCGDGRRSDRLRRLLVAGTRLGTGALPSGNTAGCGQPLRHRHFGSRRHPVGAICGGARRCPVQRW